MSAILAARDLRIDRQGRTVLSIDRMEVNEGEVLAVIGPNGAGKSTLLLALARLLSPANGEVIYCGRPLNRQVDPQYRRRIALVLQEPLLLDASAFDNVAAGLRFRRLPRAEVTRRAEEWLEKLGTLHLKDRPARQLSGGEAQRVSLARALALQPEILMLDEPFGSLDAPSRSRLLQDLQALLAEARLTTLFVTHDLDEALLLGDRVAVLLDGRLRQIGTPQQVFSSPADGDVAAFVGVETLVPGKVVRSQNGRVIVQAEGLLLEAVGEIEAGRSVLFCLRPEDVTLWRQESQPASSARNRLPGRIERLTPHGPLVHVSLDCGIPLIALITRASAEEMDLAPGDRIVASFKATAAHLIPR